MLEARGLRQYAQGRTVLAVDALRLSAGQRLAIVGPNGSGKSTLLRILALLEQPAAGTVSLDGATLVRARDRRAARRRISLVEQRPFLFRGTVLDNVAYGLVARRVAAAEAGRRAAAALALLEALPLAPRDARALSEGEAQRVAVARALAAEPDVLLLDEPASGADRAARRSLYSAIAAAQARRPLAVGVASHHLEDAYRWADDLLALHEGQVSPVTPENLFRVDLPPGEGGGEGLKHVVLGALGVDVPSDRSGPVTLAIPPDEIVLSGEPLHSSARNVLHGRIVRVAEQGAAVRVTIDGAGIELVALITRKSFAEMGLAVGTTVYAAFKSVAVRVF
jgi:tungstate transport system ATP-binding protein